MGSLISTERFFEQYSHQTGELPPSYYHNAKLVNHGWTPETSQMAYFLQNGEIVDEQLPWGKAIYYIPKEQRGDAQTEIEPLLGYFTFWVDPRRGRKGQNIGEKVTILGPQADERGMPVIEIITGNRGRVERINYTRRRGIQRLQPPPPPSEKILYLPRRDRTIGEPALI